MFSEIYVNVLGSPPRVSGIFAASFEVPVTCFRVMILVASEMSATELLGGSPGRATSEFGCVWDLVSGLRVSVFGVVAASDLREEGWVLAGAY